MTYSVTIMDEHIHLSEKCKHCHLFIEWSEDGTTIHPDGTETEGCWVHLHRGDNPDEAIEETHNAESSGLIATIDTWIRFGPPAMRARFLSEEFDHVHHDAPDYIGSLLLGGVPWERIDKSLMGVNPLSDLDQIADELDECLDAVRQGSGDPLAAIEMVAGQLRFRATSGG